jgi:hypothetical protein
MHPIFFKESNKNLLKPKNMTDEECSNLYVFTDGEICISKWKLSFMDKIRCLFHGNIWVFVFSGQTQPPIALDASKTVFKEK